MAVEPTNTASVVFHHLVTLRNEIIHTLEAEGRDRATEERLASIEDQLLITSATSLADVALKLDLLWGNSVSDDDPVGRSKASILADIRSLAALR